MKSYDKPSIIAITVRAESFFAALGEYDPADVARALDAAGFPFPSATIDPWEQFS